MYDQDILASHVTEVSINIKWVVVSVSLFAFNSFGSRVFSSLLHFCLASSWIFSYIALPLPPPLIFPPWKLKKLKIFQNWPTYYWKMKLKLCLLYLQYFRNVFFNLSIILFHKTSFILINPILRTYYGKNTVLKTMCCMCCNNFFLLFILNTILST